MMGGGVGLDPTEWRQGETAEGYLIRQNEAEGKGYDPTKWRKGKQ